jgi:crotonobetainyl-CoA:carnitine CoA-transferase CaiB-like acyl-CoA transferase
MANNYLDGITVVELGQLTGVPRAGKLLRALGARVIKLEPPHISDTAREYGPFPGGVPDRDRSGLYLLLNSGK